MDSSREVFLRFFFWDWGTIVVGGRVEGYSFILERRGLRFREGKIFI